MIELDKLVYKPGQTVRARVLAVDPRLMASPGKVRRTLSTLAQHTVWHFVVCGPVQLYPRNISASCSVYVFQYHCGPRTHGQLREGMRHTVHPRRTHTVWHFVVCGSVQRYPRNRSARCSVRVIQYHEWEFRRGVRLLQDVVVELQGPNSFILERWEKPMDSTTGIATVQFNTSTSLALGTYKMKVDTHFDLVLIEYRGRV